MDLTDGEREFLLAEQALRIDERGDEVFVGLTAEESREFLLLSRQDDARGAMDERAVERFCALRKTHEDERRQIVERQKSLHLKAEGQATL